MANNNEKPINYGNLSRFYQNLKNNDLSGIATEGDINNLSDELVTKANKIDFIIPVNMQTQVIDWTVLNNAAEGIYRVKVVADMMGTSVTMLEGWTTVTNSMGTIAQTLVLTQMIPTSQGSPLTIYNRVSTNSGTTWADYEFNLGVINDNNSSTESTYSSNKIDSLISALEARIAALEPSPDDEIWYTTTDGQPLDLSQYSYFSPYWLDSELSTHGIGVVSNTYTNGKGVIKLDHTLNGFDYNSFYLEEGDPTLLTLSLPGSILEIPDWESYPYVFGENCFASQSSLESVNYNGTKAQFMAILPQCGTEWNYYCASWTVITCTDGNLTVDPETGLITDPDA